VLQAIAFITKYQDRSLYCTDNIIYPQTSRKTAAHFEASYAADWRFLVAGEMRDYQGHPIEGLFPSRRNTPQALSRHR
jgi:hypothetical protein